MQATTPPADPAQLELAARTLRILTVDAVRAAGIGHVGLPLGCAEIGALLFAEFLKHDPADPGWPDRDRFVLSAGHGSMLLYGLLHLSGYPLPMDEIRRFRQLGSRTPGHPEFGMTPGVETTTGPLGQGLGNAVGMALSERLLAARFGAELVDHRTWVLASDGDLMEGVASEAASLAGHLGLGRLIVVYDDNHITIDGPTSLAFSEDVGRRFEAYGWDVQSCDGHDLPALRTAFAHATSDESRPHLICARTEIGRGISAAGQSKAHGAPLGDLDSAREQLQWALPPFELPEDAGAAFRAGAMRGAELRAAWEARRARAQERPELADLWRRHFERSLPGLESHLPRFRSDEKPRATRQASGAVLNALAPELPALIGGSADLEGSNVTRIADSPSVERGKFDGRNLHFGVREHGMGAIANGMALHGGVRPYVATFLVFSDYLRPSLRLAALMQLPVIYLFTHDSIFVGEDGPTHQPIEQLAALRAVPGLEVWRPADARETAVAWREALQRPDGPSALALTRQALPTLASESVEEGAAHGGYVLRPESRTPARLVLVATGSEVSCALGAADALEEQGHSVRVVSVPCLSRFLAQEAAYQRAVLHPDAPRVVVEAGVELGLAPLLRPGDRFHGMQSFGASAPYADLAAHFGFTPDAVTETALELLRERGA